MATRKRAKNVPLIIEPHPESYSGYPFITLLQYRQQHILTIIDNIDNKSIKAYVLDYCGPERVDEELVIEIAGRWYGKNSELYPLSFEFSKLGLASEVSRIYKKFNIDFVSRLIGPMVKFPMNDIQSTKRRRRKEVPSGVSVTSKVTRIH